MCKGKKVGINQFNACLISRAYITINLNSIICEHLDKGSARQYISQNPLSLSPSTLSSYSQHTDAPI